jgi:hypothetical protein
VVNFVSEVQLKQEYVNRNSNPIDAVYLFPVEEASAVVSFEAYVDGREIKTKVKEKAEAAREYAEAVRQGMTGVMLEQTKSDVFTISVGCIKTGSKVQGRRQI